jgi:hypothetical protein
MQSITFNKKHLGAWNRDDGELKKSVNEEAMFREIAKLMNDGWIVVKTSGITHVQMITIEKK